MSSNPSPEKFQEVGQRLRRARLRLNWSQEELAHVLNTTAVSISRWERGVVLPQPHYREKLCRVFQIDTNSLFNVEAIQPVLPQFWNVPYPQNPYFTGREDVLQTLYEFWHSDKKGAGTSISPIQAVCGLGGMGKTQVALEYAYRFQHEYQAVLWLRGATRETLLTDAVSLAELLSLPEKAEQDQYTIVKAVRRWLEGATNWLLVIDNVESIGLIEEVIPFRRTGHILLTMRAQSTGTLARRVELLKMEPTDGQLFLLRRAKLIETSLAEVSLEARTRAEEIAELLDGLPLALDQAGAYIEETGCDLASYVRYYQQSRATLLGLRGQGDGAHPQPVSTTLALSYDQVVQRNPLAAEILKLCAFLHPDTVPEELFTSDRPGEMPHDQLALEAALAALRTYSLVRRRRETRTLTIHRLVQAILRDMLDTEEQYTYACKVLDLLQQVLPKQCEQKLWSVYQRYLPHIEACAYLTRDWQIRPRALGRLLHLTGVYVMERGKYDLAEDHLAQALAIYRHQEEQEPVALAALYRHQAEVSFFRGAYADGVQRCQEALAIYTRELGPEHAEIATCLNNLAALYHAQGDLARAEAIYYEGLEMRQRLLGPEHADIAESLNNLGFLYHMQGKYDQAKHFYQQALSMYERTQIPESFYIARTLNNLASLALASGDYLEAEPLCLRAQAIYEVALGPDHPLLAFALHNLAESYRRQHLLEQARTLHRRALAIREKRLAPDHPDVATTLHSLGCCWWDEGRYDEALPLYQRALAIREAVLGPEHIRTAHSLYELARLYICLGQYKLAEQFCQRALIIRERTWGVTHPEVVATRKQLTEILLLARQEALKDQS